MAKSDELVQDLVSLREAAEVLRLHRATVNEMVNSGRLRGFRLGANWYVRASELRIFSQTYQRPRNAGRRHNTSATQRRWCEHLLAWLLLWTSATTEELDRVLDLHVGNIRKYLVFCEQDGLAARDDSGCWALTDEGRARAQMLPPAGEAATSDRSFHRV